MPTTTSTGRILNVPIARPPIVRDVNVKHQDMFQKLSELKEAPTESTTLSDTEKLEVAVDIETLKDQLVKPQPDREVVGRLWPRIEKAAALAGLGSLALELGQLAQKLLQ